MAEYLKVIVWQSNDNYYPTPESVEGEYHGELFLNTRGNLGLLFKALYQQGSNGDNYRPFFWDFPEGMERNEDGDEMFPCPLCGGQAVVRFDGADHSASCHQCSFYSVRPDTR